MKGSKRIIIALLIVTLVSTMAITALASNYTDSYFYSFSLDSIQKYLYPREKMDYTPCYIYITDATYNQTVFVTAYGCSSTSIVTRNNCTCDASGSHVTRVSILPYQQYLIRSSIYEWGYSYASLGLSTPVIAGNVVSGCWSPDSIGSYPYAQ